MTLTAIALMSWLTRASMISFCLAGSPPWGLRKTHSTPASAAAWLHPASQMVQKLSGLLLTNATLGRGPPAAVGLAELHAGRAARASGRASTRAGRRRAMARSSRGNAGESDGDEDTASAMRGKARPAAGRIDGAGGGRENGRMDPIKQLA